MSHALFVSKTDKLQSFVTHFMFFSSQYIVHCFSVEMSRMYFFSGADSLQSFEIIFIKNCIS